MGNHFTMFYIENLSVKGRHVLCDVNIYIDTKQTLIARCACVWETVGNYDWRWLVFTVRFSKRVNQKLLE